MIYYVVTLEQGENWNANRPMREQEHWAEHARLMDALVDDGFIVLGGPLNDGEKALLIINAESKQAIEARLADDPWIAQGVRRIVTVVCWEILLGQTEDARSRLRQPVLCIVQTKMHPKQEEEPA